MELKKVKNGIFYIMSFLVGGALMGSELLVAKLIGPYYGASIYVWAATIGTTLIGLALGYYYAGVLSEKEINPIKTLQILLLVTFIYLLLLYHFSAVVMKLFLPLELTSAIIISTLIFNAPLFFLFGIFSPLIIHIITQKSEETGNRAGFIYGISTISGVLMLVVVGVFLMPNLGNQISVYVMAGLVLLAWIILMAEIKKGGIKS